MTALSKRWGVWQFGREMGWVGAAEAVKTLSMFVSIPLLVTQMSVREFGVLSLSKVSVAIGVPLLACGLQEAFLKFTPGDPDQQRVRERYATGLLAIAVLGAALWVGFGIAAGWHVQLGIHRLLLPVLGALMAVGALDAYLQSVLRAQQRIGTNAGWVIGQSVSELGLCAAVALVPVDVVGLLSGFLLVRVACTLGRLAVLSRWLPFGRPRVAHLTEALSYGIPLMLIALLWLLLNFVDRYIIGLYRSVEEVGIYSVIYTLGTFVAIAMTPAEYVALPLVAAFLNRQQKKKAGMTIGRAFNVSVAMGIPCVMFLGWHARETLAWMTTPAYAYGAQGLPLVALGFFLLGCGAFGEHVLALGNRLRQLGGLYVWLVLLNLCLNVWLVPRIGLLGAAVATCVCFAAYAVAMLWAARRAVLWFSLAWPSAAWYVVAAGLAMGVGYGLNWRANPIWLRALFVGIVYLLLLILGRWWVSGTRAIRATSEGTPLVSPSNARLRLVTSPSAGSSGCGMDRPASGAASSVTANAQPLTSSSYDGGS